MRAIGTWVGAHRRRVAEAAVAVLAVVGGTLIAVAVNPGGGPPQAPLAGAAAPTSVTSPNGPPTSSGALPTGPTAGPTAPREPAAPPTASTPRSATAQPSPGGRATATLGAARPVSGHGLVMPRSVPVSIRIPAIGVDSHLLQLGLNADGTVQVPPLDAEPSQAGWYRYSPTPGQLGPAVILGHVDSAAHGPAVFFRLGALTAGDTVLVGRTDGSTAVFRVVRTVRYSKQHFPTDEVYGNIDHAGLRLITCGGSFDFTSKVYRDNVVVYASLVARRG